MARALGRSTTSQAPFGGAGPRLASLIAMLIALALIYSHARQPETWRWLVNDRAQPPAETSNPQPLPPPDTTAEIVIPGPTDLDPAEKAEAERLFQAVDDRTALSPVEMPSYWQLFKWTHAQSFADMEARARRDVSFADVWQSSEQHRGELVRIELHIRRVLDYPPRGENSLGVTRVYEAWGATDQSQSHPYILLFSELPQGLPTGETVRADAVFVGYFLKTMSYLAGDKWRAAPLLIGRIRPTVLTAPSSAPTGLDKYQSWFMIAGGALIVGFGVWRMRSRSVRPRPAAPTAAKAAELANWLSATDADSPDEAPPSHDSQ